MGASSSTQAQSNCTGKYDQTHTTHEHNIQVSWGDFFSSDPLSLMMRIFVLLLIVAATITIVFVATRLSAKGTKGIRKDPERELTPIVRHKIGHSTWDHQQEDTSCVSQEEHGSRECQNQPKEAHLGDQVEAERRHFCESDCETSRHHQCLYFVGEEVQSNKSTELLQVHEGEEGDIAACKTQHQQEQAVPERKVRS